VKQTLPPSLNGFPGEAEIRYFVKVTVNRPQFYKENPRVVSATSSVIIPLRSLFHQLVVVFINHTEL
jgi:hypothetical protein